jgi:hypothetical protein
VSAENIGIHVLVDRLNPGAVNLYSRHMVCSNRSPLTFTPDPVSISLGGMPVGSSTRQALRYQARSGAHHSGDAESATKNAPTSSNFFERVVIAPDKYSIGWTLQRISAEGYG